MVAEPLFFCAQNFLIGCSVPLGGIAPEQVVTPGIYVDRVVEVPNPGSEREMIEKDVRYKVGGGA